MVYTPQLNTVRSIVGKAAGNQLLVTYGHDCIRLEGVSGRDSVESLLKRCLDGFKVTEAEAKNVCLAYIGENSSIHMMLPSRQFSSYAQDQQINLMLIPTKKTFTFLIGHNKIKRQLDMTKTVNQTVTLVSKSMHIDFRKIKMKVYFLNRKNSLNDTIVLDSIRLNPAMQMLSITKLNDQIHGFVLFAENFESHNFDYSVNDDIVYSTLKYIYINGIEVFLGLSETKAAKLCALMYKIKSDKVDGLEFKPQLYLPPRYLNNANFAKIEKKFPSCLKNINDNNTATNRTKFISIILNGYKAYSCRFFECSIVNSNDPEKLKPNMDALIGISDQNICLMSYQKPSYSGLNMLISLKLLNYDLEMNSSDMISIKSHMNAGFPVKVTIISKNSSAILECFRYKISNFINISAAMANDSKKVEDLTSDYLRDYLASKNKIRQLEQKIMYFNKHGMIKFRKNTSDEVMSIFSKSICKQQVSKTTESFVLENRKFNHNSNSLVELYLDCLKKEIEELKSRKEDLMAAKTQELNRNDRIDSESKISHRIDHLMHSIALLFSETRKYSSKNQESASLDKIGLIVALVLRAISTLAPLILPFSCHIETEYYAVAFIQFADCAHQLFSGELLKSAKRLDELVLKLEKFLEIISQFKFSRIISSSQLMMKKIFETLLEECSKIFGKAEELYEYVAQTSDDKMREFIDQLEKYLMPIVRNKCFWINITKDKTVSNNLSSLIKESKEFIDNFEDSSKLIESSESLIIIVDIIRKLSPFVNETCSTSISKNLKRSLRKLKLNEDSSESKSIPTSFYKALNEIEQTINNDINFLKSPHILAEEKNIIFEFINELKIYKSDPKTKKSGKSGESTALGFVDNFNAQFASIFKSKKSQDDSFASEIIYDELVLNCGVDITIPLNDTCSSSTHKIRSTDNTTRKTARKLPSTADSGSASEVKISKLAARNQSNDPIKNSKTSVRKEKILQYNVNAFKKLKSDTKKYISSCAANLEAVLTESALIRDKHLFISNFYGRIDRMSSYIEMASNSPQTVSAGGEEESEENNSKEAKKVLNLFQKFVDSSDDKRFQLLSSLSVLQTNYDLHDYAFEDYSNDVNLLCTSFIYALFDAWSKLFDRIVQKIRSNNHIIYYASFENEMRALSIDFYTIFTHDETTINDDYILTRNFVILGNIFELMINCSQNKRKIDYSWSEFCEYSSSSILNINQLLFNLNASHESQKHFANNIFKFIDIIHFMDKFGSIKMEKKEETLVKKINSKINMMLKKSLELVRHIFDDEIESVHSLKTELNYINQQISEHLEIMDSKVKEELENSVATIYEGRTFVSSKGLNSNKSFSELLDLFEIFSSSLFSLFKIPKISIYCLYTKSADLFRQVISFITFCIKKFPDDDELDELYMIVTHPVRKYLLTIQAIFSRDLINNENIWYQVFAKLYKNIRSITQIILNKYCGNSEILDTLKPELIIDDKSYCLINYLGEFLSALKTKKIDRSDYFILESIEVFADKENISQYVNKVMQNNKLNSLIQSGMFRDEIFSLSSKFIRSYDIFSYSLSSIKEINYKSNLQEPGVLKKLLQSIENTKDFVTHWKKSDDIEFYEVVENIDDFLNDQFGKASAIIDFQYDTNIFTPAIDWFIQNSLRRLRYLMKRSSMMISGNKQNLVVHYHQILEQYTIIHQCLTKYPFAPKLLNNVMIEILLDNYQYMPKNFAKKHIHPSITKMINNIIMICDSEDHSDEKIDNLIYIFLNSLNNLTKVISSSNPIIRSCKIVPTNVMYYSIELESSIELFRPTYIEINNSIRNSFQDSLWFINDAIVSTVGIYSQLLSTFKKNSQLNIDPSTISSYLTKIDWLMKLFFESIQSYIVSLDKKIMQKIFETVHLSVAKLTKVCDSLEKFFHVHPTDSTIESFLSEIEQYFRELIKTKRIIIENAYPDPMNSITLVSRLTSMQSGLTFRAPNSISKSWLDKIKKDLKNSMNRMKPDLVDSVNKSSEKISELAEELNKILFDVMMIMNVKGDGLTEHYIAIIRILEHLILETNLISTKFDIKPAQQLTESFIDLFLNRMLKMFLMGRPYYRHNMITGYFEFQEQFEKFKQCLDAFEFHRKSDQFNKVEEKLRQSFVEITLNSKFLVLSNDDSTSKDSETAKNNTINFVEKVIENVVALEKKSNSGIVLSPEDIEDFIEHLNLSIFGIAFCVGNFTQQLPISQQAYIFRNMDFEPVILILSKIIDKNKKELKHKSEVSSKSAKGTIFNTLKDLLIESKHRLSNLLEQSGKKSQKFQLQLYDNNFNKDFAKENALFSGNYFLENTDHTLDIIGFYTACLKYSLEQAKSLVLHNSKSEKSRYKISKNFASESAMYYFLKIASWCSMKMRIFTDQNISKTLLDESFILLKNSLRMFYSDQPNNKDFTKSVEEFYKSLEPSLSFFSVNLYMKQDSMSIFTGLLRNLELRIGKDYLSENREAKLECSIYLEFLNTSGNVADDFALLLSSLDDIDKIIQSSFRIASDFMNSTNKSMTEIKVSSMIIMCEISKIILNYISIIYDMIIEGSKSSKVFGKVIMVYIKEIRHFFMEILRINDSISIDGQGIIDINTRISSTINSLSVLIDNDKLHRLPIKTITEEEDDVGSETFNPTMTVKRNTFSRTARRSIK